MSKQTSKNDNTGKNLPSGKRTRFFSLTTYASEKQIQNVVRDHIRSIRAFCYILHDQDEAETHHHILMRTHSAWTPTQVSKWFSALMDKEKKPINTFCEIANDMDALKEYILHADVKSREEGKHLYAKEDIKDFGMCDLSERKDCYDNSYEILTKVLANANPRDLVRYYGRDFLYHLNAYYECADKIRELEGYKEASMFSRMEMFSEKNLTKVEDIDEL